MPWQIVWSSCGGPKGVWLIKPNCTLLRVKSKQCRVQKHVTQSAGVRNVHRTECRVQEYAMQSEGVRNVHRTECRV